MEGRLAIFLNSYHSLIERSSGIEFNLLDLIIFQEMQEKEKEAEILHTG